MALFRSFFNRGAILFILSFAFKLIRFAVKRELTLSKKLLDSRLFISIDFVLSCFLKISSNSSDLSKLSS